MKIPLYQVDAFTDRVFGGNPAAVCPLQHWPDDDTLQSIAAENNLAETAFFVPEGDGFRIRWLTPRAEVDLCGHATLATAYVIFNRMAYSRPSILFDSRSGRLTVTRHGNWYTLNFPTDRLEREETSPDLASVFGQGPLEVYRGKTDLMLVFGQRADIENMRPDFGRVARLKERGVIVTAPGDDTDFVSRFFAPAVGIDEDPVTGSAHTSLTPYWSARLGKKDLTARQISERGGYLKCTLLGNRVDISGQAAFYLAGEIEL